MENDGGAGHLSRPHRTKAFPGHDRPEPLLFSPFFIFVDMAPFLGARLKD